MKQSIDLPLVTVCCLAYNLKEYVTKALEGILMQRTNFVFEIIVHDDASTDGTTEIIKNYVEKYPKIIRPILQTSNKFSIGHLNYIYCNYIYPIVKSKYIAYCDADDYWIDPLKLQKQIDFLEHNIEYGLVHTKTIEFAPKTRTLRTIGIENSDFASLIQENTLVFSTVCLRNDLLQKYLLEIEPLSHTNWTTHDYELWLWIILHSKFKYINEYTCIYNKLETSVSHNTNEVKLLSYFEGLNDMLDYYLHKYNISDKLKNKVRANYTSKMIRWVFLNKKWDGILRGIKVFYFGKAWLDLFWILMTIPFYYFPFLVKGSYFLKKKLFKTL